MAERMSGDPGAEDRFVRLDDGDMHLVQDGTPDAAAVLLIHGTAGSVAWWDPVVPPLADAYRVIRVDLLGHGRSSIPAGGYDIPAQARRAGAALDRLSAGRVTVIGHSTGARWPRPWPSSGPAVAALALIDTGPSLDADLAQGLLGRGDERTDRGCQRSSARTQPATTTMADRLIALIRSSASLASGWNSQARAHPP